MHYLRFLYILYVLVWYRLDEFIGNQGAFKYIHGIFNVLLFWRKKVLPRGERLRLALEKLGPIFVKFGQMLSTRRDLLPPDVADELAKLQDQVPPFDFAEAKQVVESAFEQSLTEVYSNFEPTPIASASVAQVHFAELLSGEKVAVKVLRPGIAKIIHQDIALIRTLAKLLKSLSSECKRLKPLEIVDEFSRHTEHELDLTLEAANCSQLSRNFPDKRLLIPNIHWDFCRKTVMTMERMHGTPISQLDALRAKGINITKLAHDGVEIFFTQVFRDGFFHADMHPGNIQVADDGRYIALDFGIMGTLSENDKYYLARNFLAFFNRDYRDVAVAHVESGWVPKETNIDELETAVRAICEPIFNKPLKEISFGRTLLSLFQMSRRFGVIIQPQLVMLQKTLLNIEGLGRELDPNIDLWQSAKPFLKRWMSEQVGLRSVAKNLKKELPYILKHAPEMPRLWHQFLTRHNTTQTDTSVEERLATLTVAQERQNKMQGWLIAIIVILVLLQLASLVIILN